jgi:hypothetical protein
MDVREIKPVVNRGASTAVIWPITGMVGGLLAGVFRARSLGLIDLDFLSCTLKWGVTGFFAGLGLVLLLAMSIRRGDVLSIRRLMALVAIAGVVAWFFARILFRAIGYEGF